MEGIIPFEQGVLYQLINNELKNKYSNYFINNINYELRRKFSSNSACSIPFSGFDFVEFGFGFKPIAFKEKEQKVVGEIFLNERTVSSQLTTNNNYSGINFETIDITENISRPFRVEIDVNDFIKDFEKIL